MTAPVYDHGLDGVDQPANYLFINLLIAFFVTLGLVTVSLRLWKLAENYIRHVNCTGAGRDSQQYWTANRTSFWPWLKRNLLYAPLWNKRHNRELQLSKAYNIGTLPSRLHALIILLYFLSNLIYCLFLRYSQPRAAVLAELRGRSGALATFNLIPTVLFALRNNPLIGVMRVSYDTFNLLHRWLARIVILESLTHVLCWIVNTAEQSGAAGIGRSLSTYQSFQWGLSAFVIFAVMLLAAWSPVRHAFYEIFINTHRLFAFAAFVGVYQHLVQAGLPQTPYVVLAAIFWALEWTWRCGTIILYNIARGRPTLVTVEALPKDACRVTFAMVRQWRYKPGSHAHVYLPRVGLWSSHPFSLAWSDDLDAPRSAEGEGKLPTTVAAHDTFTSQRGMTTAVYCIIRSESGMTRKLYETALAAPNRTITLYGAVEGPYGGHESLDSYGTVILFAGGVGITHQLGFVRHLVEGHRTGTVATRKIHLVWSITYVECLEWVQPFMDQILAMGGRRDVLQVDLFVTRGTIDISSKTGTVKMHKGRCSIQEIIDDIYLARIGAMAVTICGPGSFSDDVRQAVRRRVGYGAVDFIEEAFTY